MVKPDLFLIRLDNPNGVYYAGQLVTGKLYLTVKSSLKLRSLRLSINGHAKVHWSEEHREGTGENRRSHTVHYSAEQEYLCMQAYLVGQPGDSSQVIKAGTHQFDISFRLPQNCATSFEGGYGHIRYSITGIIDRPWKFDHTTKCPFTVIGMIDLNFYPNAGLAVTASNTKSLGMLLWKAGNLSCTVRLPQRGFVPGEPVSIIADVDNQSSRTVKKITINIVQNVAFWAKHHHWEQRTSSRKVGELCSPVDIKEKETKSLRFPELKIPSVPPVLQNCSLIELSYCLEVKVTPSGPSYSLDVDIPIIIGTVPLRRAAPPAPNICAPPTYPAPPASYQPGPSPPGAGFQPTQPPVYPPPDAAFATGPPNPMTNLPQNPYAPPVPNDGGAAGVMPSAPPLPSNMYPDLPPPSYEECVTGRTNIREQHEQYTQGDMDFAPRYPMYNLPPAEPLPQKQ